MPWHAGDKIRALDSVLATYLFVSRQVAKTQRTQPQVWLIPSVARTDDLVSSQTF
jgi:hypothetical protein